MSDCEELSGESHFLLTERCFESSTGPVYCSKRSVFSNQKKHDDIDILIKRLPSYFNNPIAVKILQDYIDKMNQYNPHYKVELINQHQNKLLVYHLTDGELLTAVLEKRNTTLSYQQVIFLLKKFQQELSRLSVAGWRHGRLELNSVYIFKTGRVYFLDQVVVATKQRLLALRIIPWTTVPNAEALTASPEVCFGRKVIDQDDVYNLSTLAYQLLSGELPYEYQNSAQALLERQLPTRIKGLSNSQWAILRKGLAFHSSDRFLSSKMLLSLLLHCCRQKKQSGSQTPSSEPYPVLELTRQQTTLENPTVPTVTTEHPVLIYLYEHLLVFSAGIGVFFGMWLMSQLMAI